MVTNIFLGTEPENSSAGLGFDFTGGASLLDYCIIKNTILERLVPSVRYNWDISVSGDGFLQLMGADGNIDAEDLMIMVKTIKK